MAGCLRCIKIGIKWRIGLYGNKATTQLLLTPSTYSRDNQIAIQVGGPQYSKNIQTFEPIHNAVLNNSSLNISNPIYFTNTYSQLEVIHDFEPIHKKNSQKISQFPPKGQILDSDIYCNVDVNDLNNIDITFLENNGFLNHNTKYMEKCQFLSSLDEILAEKNNIDVVKRGNDIKNADNFEILTREGNEVNKIDLQKEMSLLSNFNDFEREREILINERVDINDNMVFKNEMDIIEENDSNFENTRQILINHEENFETTRQILINHEENFETTRQILIGHENFEKASVENFERDNCIDSKFIHRYTEIQKLQFSDTKSSAKGNIEGQGGQPSAEDLSRVFNVLAETLPKLFVQPLDYTIYDQNIIFENNIRGIKTQGLMAYIKQVAFLRTVGHLRFAYIKFDILKITKHPEDSTIKVRWRIRGLSGLKAMFQFWKIKLWDWDSVKEQMVDWYDGFSTFYINQHGLVYKHVADSMMPDEERQIVQKGILATKMAAIYGFNVFDGMDGSLFSSKSTVPVDKSLV